MTLGQANTIVAWIISVGGLTLLVLATSAAIEGLYGTAAFIGLCGAALLGTVSWEQFRSRKSHTQISGPSD